MEITGAHRSYQKVIIGGPSHVVRGFLLELDCPNRQSVMVLDLS